MIIVGYRYDIIGSQLVIAIRERERNIFFNLMDCFVGGHYATVKTR